MPNNYLSVLYKHIIQVEIKNVGLKVVFLYEFYFPIKIIQNRPYMARQRNLCSHLRQHLRDKRQF